jgi:hypothetical protein
MPAGPSVLGFVYFAAAKYAGYTAFCRWFIEPRVRALEPPPANVQPAWKAGGVRTLLGVAVGAVVGLGFWKIPFFSTHDNAAEVLFFALLVPVRVFEWWLLLRLMYPQSSLDTHRRFIWAIPESSCLLHWIS